MKKVMSLIISLVLAFSLSVPVFAADDNNTERITQFIQNRNENASITNIVPMYDTNDTIIAWLYILDPIGYVVEDSSHEIIIEFSMTSTFEYNSNKLYYGGPTQFYTKAADTFSNIKSDTTMSVVEVSESTSNFTNRVNEILTSKSNGIAPLANTPPYSLDKNKFQTYDYNPDGRCGSVSAAILLSWYNDNGYSNLVSSSMYSNAETFTNYLTPHIEGLTSSSSGSSTADLVSGLNWYLGVKNFSKKLSAVSLSNGSYSTYIKKIDANTPVILDLDAAPTYNEHWVVGYGYDYDQIIIKYNEFAICNDGWGNLDININWKYVGDLVYLK